MNDFDFLAGGWSVANRRRREFLAGWAEWEEFPATSQSVRLFAGAANLDWYSFPTLGSSGLSVRLCDPSLQQWSIYWVSNRDGILQPPVIGGFADGVGSFYGDDTYRGPEIRVRFLGSEITARWARWDQAFSIDRDQSWETNWIMNFDRQQ